jgi:parallel beta-helix repeat protein
VGIYAAPGSDSDRLTVRQMVVYGNSSRGIFLHASNDQVTIQNSTFYGLPGGSGADDQSNAIYVEGTDALVSGNTITNSQHMGIQVHGARTIVSGNQLANNNSTGIHASFAGALADRIVVSGNTVHHGGTGIEASAHPSFPGVLVTGNEVYNLVTGLFAGPSVETVDNRVHDNTNGIWSQYSGLVRDNRVWHNANIGIVMDRATVSGNRVYANSIGIQTSGPYGFSGQRGTAD